MQLNPNKKKIRTKILLDSVLVFFIAISPFLFKIYDYLPKDDHEATVDLFIFEIGSNGFADVSTYVWFMMGKIIPLYLMLFWFFTCKEWWYHIILIPITMYSFQIFEEVFTNDNIIDSESILWLLPICMIVIPIVYFIRIKLYDKHVHGIDLEAMDAELKFYQEKERLKKEKELEQKKL
jgi:hypothetical protein